MFTSSHLPIALGYGRKITDWRLPFVVEALASKSHDDSASVGDFSSRSGRVPSIPLAIRGSSNQDDSVELEFTSLAVLFLCPVGRRGRLTCRPTPSVISFFRYEENSSMKRYCLLFGITMSLAVDTNRPASAINRSWDDAGGSASKLWGEFGNWSPDGAVGADDIFIGNLAAAANDTTLVDAAYSINSLTITNGADVVNSTDNGATNDFELIVNGLTTVGGAGSSIIIFGGDPDGLDTDNLTINSGGSVILNSTTAQGTAVVEVDGNTGTGLLDINAGGTLIGTGRIDLEAAPGAATSLIVNDGSIIANRAPIFLGQAPAAGTLQITATSANARFDWDGGGAGVLQANGNQTLDIDVVPGAGAVTDAFSGTMNLNTGGTIDIANAWSMDSGTINANTPAFGLIIIGQDPNPGPAAHIAGANWTMTGGTITVDDTWDSLQFDSQLVASGGTIDNSGTMIFNGGATIQSGVDFNMIGDGASLVVNSALNIDTPDFNLDGSEHAGNVTTINAGGNLDLDLGTGADLSFGHTINMNGGELDVTSSVATAWQLNSIGVINAAGGAISTINSAGETFQISGDINVTANSTLNINSVSEYTSNASVVIDAGSTLNMGTATYSGGSYSGGGTLLKGTATIAAATTWNVATVDLDDGVGTSTTLNANLTINADAIDSSGDGIDNGIAIDNAALLTVNISGGGSWAVDPAGSITYNGDATPNSFLAGSDINLNGNLNVTGDGRTDARLLIGSTSTININTAAEPLRLSGGNTTTNPNTIAGGTINGPGLLGADTGSALHGFGTINANVDFDGTSNLLAQNGTLTVSGALVDVSVLGTADVTGVINVTSAWNTNVTAIVLLKGGRLQGGLVTNDGVNGIDGFGEMTARVINNTLIAADNGTLIYNNSQNDWDGAANNGLIIADNGNVELVDLGAFLFNGTVRADANRQVFANGFELEFEPASTLALNGGTYRSTAATDIGGTVTIGAGTSTLNNGGTTIFEGTSNTTITGTLRLNNTATRINAGATFAGGGTLLNVAGRTLTLVDGADVDVLLQNDGTLVLGTSPGQTQGLDFEQTATGTWNVELGGTGINDYDRMTLSGLAAVDGTLDLALLAPYVPTLADPLLTILSASSVSGTFDAVVQPPTMPAGLAFSVIYNAANIQLQVVNALLAGDYNNNGIVDAADYVLWRNGGPLQNDPTPGVQPADYDVWRAHFGQTAGSGSGVEFSAAVPEPSIIAMALLAIVGSLLLGSRGGRNLS